MIPFLALVLAALLMAGAAQFWRAERRSRGMAKAGLHKYSDFRWLEVEKPLVWNKTGEAVGVYIDGENRLDCE